jgi:hypothetical protein
MAGEDLKISLDNIVGGIRSSFNNFIRLRKIPCRRYRRDETNSSNWNEKGFREKLSLAKNSRIDKIDHGQ